MITNKKKSDTHFVLKKRSKAFFIIIILLLRFQSASSQDNFVSFSKSTDAFPIVANNKAIDLVIDKNDWTGVQKIAGLFQDDIEKVTSTKPQIHHSLPKNTSQVILIGTLGKNELIDELVKNKKIDVSKLRNKWETSLIQVVGEPFKGVDKALVIIGSDKRGTIYGMFDISRKIGISPWHFWADVPAKKHNEIYINKSTFNLGTPKVKYRGVFLNDEAPALTEWVKKNYGDYNSKFYIHVFELILRLKGNFLWPAMWNNAFADDDPQNMILADEYGIVMSTSHHEPMMRADKEWDRYGKGAWEYSTNPENLYKFWVEGAKRYKDHECVYTLGMRGQQDKPMSEGENIELLEKIVKDQREILTNVNKGRDITNIPQVWCLYKEVQAYYDKGMRVDDDITLLLCDDNWGDVRVLPKLTDKPRKGGYGMYYHFDYVGGPRSYKWLNTSSLPRVWEQLNLSYNYGVDRIWLVNVGDLKPMELPISFFLDFAWDPEEMSTQKLDEYTTNWATEQFGKAHANEIGKILKLYPKYNARRKPESLFSDTYSLVNYLEFERVVADYKKLEKTAKQIYNEQDSSYKDAFYQLVYYPVSACANLNEMYYAHAKNLLYAKQGRTATNDMAKKVEELFKTDAELTEYYHTKLANGKWDHMMAQTHIGYNSWRDPQTNIMPKVKTIKLPAKGELGMMIEGSDKWWPEEKQPAKLEFDSYNQQSYFIELFNRGKESLSYSFSKTAPWVELSSTTGTIEKENRVTISVNWEKAKPGQNSTKLTVISNNKEIATIEITATKYNDKQAKGFVETNGYISIEAANYTKANNTKEISWEIFPEIGKTLHGVTPVPLTKKIETPGKNTPSLEYEFYLLEEPKDGVIKIDYHLSPTLNFLKGKGLHFAVSVDDEPLQKINMHEGTEVADWKYPNWWNQAVLNSIIMKSSTHKIAKQGKHVLKFWLIDPGIVLQKIVINAGGLKPSYLGPPESRYIK